MATETGDNSLQTSPESGLAMTQEEILDLVSNEFGVLSQNKFAESEGLPTLRMVPWEVSLPDGKKYRYLMIEDRRLDLDGDGSGHYDYGVCVLKFDGDTKQFLGFAYKQAIEGSSVSLGYLKAEALTLQQDVNKWLTSEGGWTGDDLNMPDAPVPVEGTPAALEDILPPGEFLGPELPTDEEKPISQLIDEIMQAEDPVDGETFTEEELLGNFAPVLLHNKLAGKYSYKYTNQQILMSSLNQLTLLAQSFYNLDPNRFPKNYIRTSNPEEIHTPPHRMKAISTTSLRRILEMTTLEVSSLMPKIQLFKVYRDELGNIEKEIFIPYTTDSMNFIKDVFANKHQRGDDVGIKNVSFVYENQNMATAETLLGCTIEFIFQNAETLVTDRDGFRFIDLFAFSKTDNSDNYDKGAYEIILKVGYEVPSGQGVLVSSELREALREQEEMFQLQLVDYDVVFDPTGKLDATMNYSSANVEWFTAPTSDIFGLKKQIGDKDEQENGPSDEILGAPKRLLDKVTLYSSIMQYMADNGMIHEISADLVDLGQEPGPLRATDPNINAGTQTDANLKEEAASEYANSVVQPPIPYDHLRTIPFFFFGDLIETIIEINPSVHDELVANKFAIVLDTVGYQFAKDLPIEVFNLAFLPVSMESYADFFQNNYIKKDVKLRALLDFVKDTITSFLNSMLRVKRNDQLSVDYKPQLVRQIVAVPNGLSDVDGIGGISTLKQKRGQSFYAKTAKDYFEYYVVYDEAIYEEKLTQFIYQGTGDRYERNLEAKIPHFFIGADRGLLKSFTFEKASINQSVAVARNIDNENPLQQLWQIFNVNMNLIGNNLMFVGRTLYLDPTISGLGSPFTKGTVSNTMGLGGYYMIEKVSHSYYPSWETVVSAKIIDSARPDEASPGGDLVLNYLGNSSSPDTNTPIPTSEE